MLNAVAMTRIEPPEASSFASDNMITAYQARQLQPFFGSGGGDLALSRLYPA